MVVYRDKKEALLAKKQQLLQEIKYCESRIAEARNYSVNRPSSCSDAGSDSDDDITLHVDIGPNIQQLKQKEGELRNCIHATNELCDIHVIESEVTVLADPPKLEYVKPISEPGIWKEVTAECSVDLIRVVLSFYMHRPERQFAPTSFRGLRVKLVKTKHEIELNKSVLPDLTRPSDAVDVIRSYAVASRSRRLTLARLLDKFPNDITMDTKPDGGFIIECPLMKIYWRLQNKWSPVAPFHHRLCFDVEYMDEKYVMAISQAHRQMSEPEVDTDERTLLLAKIIGICLQAKGPTQELHETMSSDVEDPNYLEKLRIRMDKEPEAPGMHSKTKDSTIMAPPKMLPKKSKSKAKGNTVDNVKSGKTTKRSIQNGGENSAKKVKGDGEKDESNGQEIAKLIENMEKNRNGAKNKTDDTVAKATKEDKHKNVKSTEKSVTKVATEKNKQSENVASEKNVAKTVGEKKKQEKVASDNEVVQKSNSNDKVIGNDKLSQNVDINKVAATEKSLKKAVNTDDKQSAARNGYSAGRLPIGTKKSVAMNKNRDEKTAKFFQGSQKVAKKTQNNENKNINKDVKKVVQGKVVKKVLNKSGTKVVKKVMKTGIVAKPKLVLNKNDGKRAEAAKNVINTTFTTEKSSVVTEQEKLLINPIKTVIKTVAGVQTKNPTVVKKGNNMIQSKTITDENKVKSNIVKPKHTAVSKNVPFKTFNPKSGNTRLSAGKISKTGNIAKENKVQNKVVSKIPQKQNVSEVVLKKHPLRLSPRKELSKPGTSGYTKPAAIKPVSNTLIPRLAPKPKPRVT